MIAVARTLTLTVLAPPLILLLWAHVLRPVWSGLDDAVLAIALSCGLAGVAVAPCSRQLRIALAVGYVLLALIALPVTALFAVCSTGDCL